MNEINSLRKMYNGITNYFINIADNTNQKKAKTMLDREDIIHALIATISFDIIFIKEQLVEKTEGVIYKSKLSDNELDKMMNYINGYNNKIIFEDSATMLAFIRNKFAHGDYHIDLENNRLCFKRNTEDIFVDLKILIDFYIEYSEALQHRFKGNSFQTQFAINKGGKVITKPIETDRELDLFLALFKIKKYNLKKLNGEDLTSEEKRDFVIDIKYLQYQLQNQGDEKLLDRMLIDKYFNKGYVIDINKSKIKDENLKAEIKNLIKKNNDIAEENGYHLSYLVYLYGNCINKFINEYSTECIEIGLDLNEYILKKMYYNDIYDFKEFINQESAENNVYISNQLQEIFVATSLIRFYSLYWYPLESIYQNNKIYHMDRSDLFPFDELDLSEFNPDIINIDKIGIKEAEDRLRHLGKSIISKNNKLNEREKNIIGLSKKNNLNSHESEKLESFKKEVEKLKREIDDLYEMYMEASQYYNYVKNDYNNVYFKNKAIIAGMRDALAHANVKIKNAGIAANIKELGIEFNDIYEGKVEFNLKTDFYSLENLYEARNVDIIDDYITKIKR